jgi:hypothetical protein
MVVKGLSQKNWFACTVHDSNERGLLRKHEAQLLDFLCIYKCRLIFLKTFEVPQEAILNTY